MAHKSASRSLLVAALLGIGVIVAPNLASAGDSAARIQPVDPSTLAAYGNDMPLLSSGGAVVTGNAWCDPINNTCLRHPWLHPRRGK